MSKASNLSEEEPSRQLALVLTGGGARSAYQAGVVHFMKELVPEITFPIITGVSAGAINAAFLAGHSDPGGQKLYYIVGRISVRIRFTCLNPA